MSTTATMPAAARRLRLLRLLVTAYATLSVLTVGVLALLHAHPAQATSTAWVRGVIVAATSLILLAVVAAVRRGSTRALLRLRIIAAIMVVAIAVFLAVPGSLPAWMKVEQAVCGVLLLGVLVVAARLRR